MGRVSKQLEYLALFNQGYSVTQIAKMTGKNRSTISRTLTRARSKTCPFSSDCMKCPLDDCAIEDKYADMINEPPGRNTHKEEVV